MIIVEDIVDTGGTLDTLIKRMTENGAASVKVAALLNKEARRKVDVPVQYEGFKCEDSFVVGCASPPHQASTPISPATAPRSTCSLASSACVPRRERGGHC